MLESFFCFRQVPEVIFRFWTNTMALKNGVTCNYDKSNSGCCIEMHLLSGSKLINTTTTTSILCLLNTISDISRWWNKAMILAGKLTWFIHRKKRSLLWGSFGSMAEVGARLLNFSALAKITVDDHSFTWFSTQIWSLKFSISRWQLKGI